ncbi:hypothetical protein [Paenibacillus solani]|uniref:Uncharacterized protein n=1 Tax=Paenibacillus solani TaxID=1705565 RepID=A0A0M1NZB1_9BACL|nr:hypothetical protein [Paenibacillus solani]KOR87603.1 hypothetical protein AM231_17010 [Paenibacillus solani]
MKKVTIVSSTLIAVLVIVFSLTYYNRLSPSITSADIQIEGRITPFDENNVLVELDIVRLKDELASHYIYPVASGLGNISFVEDPGYYTPGSIGTWYESEELLRRETSDKIAMDHIGFAIPTQKGNYKTKFTMNKLENTNGQAEIELYYVHVEKKYGKTLSWIKKIPLSS